jgi:hypothetical protein
MRTFFIFQKDDATGSVTETIELLDGEIELNEGDSITVTEGNKEIPCIVTKVQKIIRREGNNCTASTKIFITNAN